MTLSSSAPRLVRSRALVENVDSRASARLTLSRGHEDGRDVWGDALNAASAGTSPMTPSSVAGASQRIATSRAPPTNSTSLFDADEYIIRDYADLTPPARRKRAHGGPHAATPWLPPLRKRVALDRRASVGRESSIASSGAARATASSDAAVCVTASSDAVKPW